MLRYKLRMCWPWPSSVDEFMKALELSINGKRLCVAGSGPGEFTFVHVGLDEREGVKATAMVAGSRGRMVPIWISEATFNVGDNVTIRVVDVDEADPATAQEMAWEFPPWAGMIPPDSTGQEQ